MNRKIVLKATNFIWFQAIWWLVILYQNNAVWFVCVLITVWLWLSPKRLADLKLMFILFVMGTAIDSVLTHVGVFIFEEKRSLVAFWPIPVWLSLLWCAFAGTVYHSMVAFQGRVALSALAGGIFAPLSYIAGANLGAVELGESILVTYLVVGIIWSIVFPFCFYLSEKISPAEIEIK